MIVWGLKNKFQIAGCLDEPVHVLEQSLRSYTGIYLGGLYVGVSQHFADGLYRHSLLERDQRGERMPSHVVDKVLAQPCHQAQGFHIGPERVVVLRREKSLAGIVPVFLNQRDGFRKQLDTSEVVGFLSLVFQPEAALVIPEEVLPGDAYRIGIGGAGVTGEEEEVPGDDM